jgi:hypothetical protein
MTPNKHGRFFEIFTALGEIYGKNISKPTMELYWQVLKEYSIEQIEFATKSIISNRKYTSFPMPAEFLDYINPQISLEEKAAVAVEELLDLMETRGVYQSIAFDDYTMGHAVNRMGGWIRLCNTIREMTDERQLGFWKRDFMRIYQYFLKLPELPEAPIQLGLHQQKGKICEPITKALMKRQVE